MPRHFLLLLLIVLGWVGPGALNAYGPNVLDATNDDGIVLWELPVVYDVESDLSLDDCGLSVAGFVEDAFTAWEAAPETNLTSTKRDLGVAVDSDNVCDYLFDVSKCPAGPSNGSGSDGVSPIVFDEDGLITAQFFGTGNRFSTLGFAGIIVSDNNTNRAIKGEGVINVSCYGEGCAHPLCSRTFTESDVRAFIQHESGHLLGLNHTQVNLGTDDAEFEQTMWAVFVPGTGDNIRSLNRDDAVGIAYLYPDSSLNDSFCTVMGTVRGEDGAEFQCANIIARNTDSTGNQNLLDAISFVSGMEKKGSSAATGRGAFAIKGLAPSATYQIEVEPISKEGVLSQAASGIRPCNGGNGNPAAPTFDEQTLSATVNCAAGETLTLADITLSNASENVADEDDDTGDGSNGTSSSSAAGCSLVR